MKKTQAIVTIWGGRGSQPRESEPPVTLRLICQPQEDTKICSGQQLVESEKGSKMQLFAEESVASGATKGQQNGAVRAAVKQQLEGVAAAGKTADEAAVRAVEKQQFGAIVADVKSPTVAAVGGAENGGNVQPKLRGHGSNLQRLHTDTLGCLRSKASKDPPMLVDIFVNYDCGLDAPNLFERMVTTLSKIAQGTQTTDPSSVVGSQNVSIKSFSLQCLVNVLKSLVDWEESHWVHA